MADYSAIRSGIKTRLATSSTFIQVAATVPDTVSTPCAIVQPGSPVADYDLAFNNGLERFVFKVTVLAQRFDEEANQTLLDGFLSGSGSIRALIDGDLTLGGTCKTCRVVSADTYGVVDVNDTPFLGCDYTVEVFA
jgi:hypothetical protein